MSETSQSDFGLNGHNSVAKWEDLPSRWGRTRRIGEVRTRRTE